MNRRGGTVLFAGTGAEAGRGKRRGGGGVRAALWAAGLAALAAGAWWGGRWVWEGCLKGNPHFAVRNLELTTDGDLPVALVAEYAGVREGMSLFDVNPGEVREKLLAVSSVADARVGRRFPDTVVIDLTERVAVAKLGGTPLAVDGTGHVLGPNQVRSGLPTLSGVAGSAALKPGDVLDGEALKRALSVLSASLQPELQKNFRVESVEAEGDWLNLKLDSGERVKLSADGAEEKLERLPLMMDAARRKGLKLTEYDLTADANPVGRATEGR